MANNLFRFNGQLEIFYLNGRKKVFILHKQIVLKRYWQAPGISFYEG